MIKVGSIVTIGGDKYQITETKEDQIACIVCEVPNCACNDAMKEWRKERGVTACEKIIGINKYLKKVPKNEHNQ